MFIIYLTLEKGKYFKSKARRADNIQRNESKISVDANTGLAKSCFAQPNPDVQIPKL